MTCPRCNGLMVSIPPLSYYNPQGASSWDLREDPAMKCLNCGAAFDSTIVHNKIRRFCDVAPLRQGKPRLPAAV